MADWHAWQFFIGDWVGAGSGQPGEGSGGFRFAFDLQGQILVRRNYAEYPATLEKPAYRHDDLMIIYPESENHFRADYFDNEGHVIHYAIEFSADNSRLIFVSEVLPSAPRFRFTYETLSDDRLGIQFEIAPPDHPEGFAQYITATARRKTIP